MNQVEKIKIESTTPKQRVQIKRACIDNAKKLVKQAHSQFKEGNYNLAVFLAITAYEESLKFGLFNSLESGLITQERFNQVWSSHKFKLLSKFATVRVYEADGGQTTKEYYLQENSEALNQETRKILDKREDSLYVGFTDSKLNIPSKSNPADSITEINRAETSIREEVSMDTLFRQLNAFKKRVF